MRIRKKLELTEIDTLQIDENILFVRVANIIENRRHCAVTHVNQETTMMFWEVGRLINSVVLGNKRAAYGKRILTELAAKLSWSHIIELLPLKTEDARMYYANDVAVRNYGTKELRRQISRKAYERREIANTELSDQSAVPFNVFKDPYLLDLFGLKENFIEADLEKAILAELETFLLEFGHGFTFVERQKRMIIDGEDIVLDLLFYHRVLKRLVAVELKLGVFKAAYKGQMELYLKWLDKYERQEGEEAPIGLILCATASREKIELLEMDKAGIAVAEYWTHLPPKAEFEAKIKALLIEAHERIKRRKSMPKGGMPKQIEYFFDSKDDDTEE